MLISKNSWHYRIWKQWHIILRISVPEQVNLCQYVGEIFFWMPISFLFFGIIIAMGLIVFGLIPNIVTILFGFGIAVPDMSSSEKLYHFRPFTGFSIEGQKIPPWSIAGPIWLAVILIPLIYFYPLYMAYVFMGLTIIFFLFFALIGKWSLMKECIKAKKQKICPIITFE